MTDKIKYLPHPVSASDKKKWCDQGFKILDSRFDPKSKAKAKPKAKTVADDDNS